MDRDRTPDLALAEDDAVVTTTLEAWSHKAMLGLLARSYLPDDDESVPRLVLLTLTNMTLDQLAEVVSLIDSGIKSAPSMNAAHLWMHFLRAIDVPEDGELWRRYTSNRVLAILTNMDHRHAAEQDRHTLMRDLAQAGPELLDTHPVRDQIQKLGAAICRISNVGYRPVTGADAAADPETTFIQDAAEVLGPDERLLPEEEE